MKNRKTDGLSFVCIPAAGNQISELDIDTLVESVQLSDTVALEKRCDSMGNEYVLIRDTSPESKVVGNEKSADLVGLLTVFMNADLSNVSVYQMCDACDKVVECHYSNSEYNSSGEPLADIYRDDAGHLFKIAR